MSHWHYKMVDDAESVVSDSSSRLLKSLLRANVLNDVTAALFLVSFSQLLAVKNYLSLLGDFFVTIPRFDLRKCWHFSYQIEAHDLSNQKRWVGVRSKVKSCIKFARLDTRMEVWAAGQQAGYLIATVWTIKIVPKARSTVWYVAKVS